jgi:hypothetical protein
MNKFLSWLKKYWYIPFFVLVVFLGWIIFRKREYTPIDQIKQKLEVIDTAAKIRIIQKEKGAVEAHAVVEATFKQKMDKLNKDQKEKARELRHDPVKLAKFLVRVGGP